MKIAILRHGKPCFIQKNRITSSDFRKWIIKYNASPLSDSSRPGNNALDYASRCGAIVSSSLQRSIDSAQALNKKKLIISDALFVEAGLPSAEWRFIKLPPDIWALFFRILWIFGYSNNSESFKETKERADAAVSKLILLAEEYQSILFSGHGVFNRMLVKELRSRGWSGSKFPGSKYWSIDVYKR